jgi:hypothetical protein
MSHRARSMSLNDQDNLAFEGRMNNANINTLIDRQRQAKILHKELANIKDDGVEKKPKDECCNEITDALSKLNQKRVQAELDDKTAKFRKYYQRKSKKIFQPSEYQRQIAGEIPTESPLLAALHASGQRSSYLTPLPAMAYRRQIDVDSKYVRQGRYIYGAQ